MALSSLARTLLQVALCDAVKGKEIADAIDANTSPSSITAGGSNLQITGQTQASGTAGGQVGLTGATGVGAAAGGIVNLTGGVGGTNSAGGAAPVTGGAGTGTGAGGSAPLTGGASGAGATGNGGSAPVTGGAALSTNGNGGAAPLTGGVATGTGTGGLASVTGGASGGASGTAGNGSVDAGAASGGTAGLVLIADANAKATYLNRGALKALQVGLTLTAIGTAQNSTPTAAQLLGGMITQTGATGAGTITLPSGTTLSSACPRTPVVGDSFQCTFANLGGGQTLTVTGASGTNVISGGAIATAKSATLTFINTAANTWSIAVSGG